MVNTRAFSIIELLEVVTIIGILILVAVPFTRGWNDGAQVAEAESILKRAVGKAQAVALRNPTGSDASSAAAGVKQAGTTLLVCEGSPASASCSAAGSALIWREDLPAGVTLNVEGAALATIAMNNRGRIINGSGQVQVLDYTVSRGEVSDNDANNRLY